MIHRNDVLNQLDWIRDDWNTSDEWQMTRKLQRLRGMLAPLHEPARTQAFDLYADLCRTRLSVGAEWRSVLVRLRLLAASSIRRPDLECGFVYAGGVRCGIRFVSERARVEHREHVHDERKP